MDIFSGFVVFTLAWWVSFFAVLPIGVQGQWENESTVEGTDEGAPQAPMLKKKVLWATISAVVLTAAAALIVPQLLAQ